MSQGVARAQIGEDPVTRTTKQVVAQRGGERSVILALQLVEGGDRAQHETLVEIVRVAEAIQSAATKVLCMNAMRALCLHHWHRLRRRSAHGFAKTERRAQGQKAEPQPAIHSAYHSLKVSTDTGERFRILLPPEAADGGIITGADEPMRHFQR